MSNTELWSCCMREEEAKKALSQSDVFIMNLNPYPTYPGNYPFNLSMNILRPQLQAIADKEFVVLGQYHYNDYLLRVYVRPHPKNG